ncbi:MAG: haloacid dehalogenase-like hydrolase [Myxococcaceae bacterium]|nr:haloacid dehalogenase-like hydrolase [Myxococcaceae bacterium]
MRPTVLLFDIDGTLVTTGGAGRRALERVFEVVYQREDACRGFRFDGMTDRAIVRNGLRAIGAPDSDAEIDRVLGHYVALLEEEVRRMEDSRYFLHRGMREVLDAAQERPHCAVGLGTGNIREGARVKLERVGIYHRFGFGGFGCDHEDRPTLIRIGAERGARALGVPLSECRVVVIGDTPKDVAAALAIGGECVGVGTGSFRPSELIACGAKWAFDDLSQPGALRAVLEGR